MFRGNVNRFYSPNLNHCVSQNFNQRILTYFVKGKLHCSADLLFNWFGFDQACYLFNISKEAESKQVKHEVSSALILYVKRWVLSSLTHYFCLSISPCNAWPISVLVTSVPEWDVAVPAALKAHLLAKNSTTKLVLFTKVDEPKIWNNFCSLQCFYINAHTDVYGKTENIFSVWSPILDESSKLSCSIKLVVHILRKTLAYLITNENSDCARKKIYFAVFKKWQRFRQIIKSLKRQSWFDSVDWKPSHEHPWALNATRNGSNWTKLFMFISNGGAKMKFFNRIAKLNSCYHNCCLCFKATIHTL